MRKEIQSYGNSKVIVLTKSDMKVYGLNKGDILDITITKVDPYNQLENATIKKQKKENNKINTSERRNKNK